MAAVTTTSSWMSVEGPRRKEVAVLASVDDGDTFVSQLQNPEYGFFVMTGDNNTTALEVNVSISGRTITFNNSSLSASAGVLTLYGF